MKYHTHLVFGLMFGLIYILVFKVIIFIPFIVLVAIGSLLPDIDNSKSFFGNKIYPFSKAIEIFLGHRGIFHSAYLLILISIPVYRINSTLGIAIFLGYFSHLIADGMTKKGVNFLNPFLELRLSGFIVTGSFAEKIIFVIICFIDVFLLLKLLAVN